MKVHNDVQVTAGYVRVPNALITDGTLSPQARLVWAYLHSLPPRWDTDRDKIAAKLGMTVHAVRKALKDLADRELTSTTRHGVDGKFTHVLHVRGVAVGGETASGQTTSGVAASGQTACGQTTSISKTEDNKTKRPKKTLPKKKSLPARTLSARSGPRGIVAKIADKPVDPKLRKKVLKLLKCSEGGLLVSHIGDTIGIGYLEVETTCKQLLEASEVHQRHLADKMSNRYLFGPKED